MVRRYGGKNYENKGIGKPAKAKAGEKAGIESNGAGAAGKKGRKR